MMKGGHAAVVVAGILLLALYSGSQISLQAVRNDPHFSIDEWFPKHNAALPHQGSDDFDYKKSVSKRPSSQQELPPADNRHSSSSEGLMTSLRSGPESGISSIASEHSANSTTDTSVLPLQDEQPNATNWIALGQQLARVYQPWTNFSWCVPQHNEYYATRFKKARKLSSISEKHIVQGLIYVKSPKTGSSTGVGISLRVAEKVAARELRHPLSCTVNHSHAFAFFGGHGRRLAPSLAWTNVRHPAHQAQSLFFHFIHSRQGVPATAESILPVLEQKLKSNQLEYLSTSQRLKRKDVVTVHRVLNLYDFVAVSDRMDESLVVMKLLYNLQDEDVIVLPSKGAGGYEPRRIKGKSKRFKECHRTVKPFAINGTADYFQYQHQVNNWDYVLYAAANHSLDLTIDALGRSRVEAELARHRHLYQQALRSCLATAIYPCTADGVYHPETDCFIEDAGCGHACVDQALQTQEGNT